MIRAAGSRIVRPNIKIDLPERRANIIAADPPWEYGDKRPGRGGCAVHYDGTLNPRQIRDLPVERLAADDCALALWVTSTHLPLVPAIMRAWGFEYRTILFVWRKVTKDRTKPKNGPGAYTMPNHEICLLGIRGSPARHDLGVYQEIEAPLGPHSAKPPEYRDRLVRLFGDVPRVELFARETAPGWLAWGNQLQGDIQL